MNADIKESNVNRKYISICLAILLVLASLMSISFHVTVAYPSSYFEYKDFSLNFLENVTGFSNYEIVSFNASTCRMPDSQHYQTEIKVVVSANNSNYKVRITLRDNKFWTYRLDLLSDWFYGEKTLSDCLVVANRTIERYREFFNAYYCNGFAEMIPAAVQNQSLLAENEKALLKISYVENCSAAIDYKSYTKLQWLQKIKNKFTTNFQSISISVSKNGLTTMIVDNLAIYYVAGTDNISMKEAVNIASPFVEAYAQEHGQETASVNATLIWNPDLGCQRGDEWAIYPIWDVVIRFDEINEESVYGYSVDIWADNGEVYYHGPLRPRFISGDESNHILLMILAIIASILGLLGFIVYRKRKVRTKVR